MPTETRPKKAPAKKSAPKRVPPAKAKTAETAKGRLKGEARQKAAAELADELKLLRAALKEIVRQVHLRIDAGIADALEVLEKKQAPGQPCLLPGAKSSAQMAKKLRAVKITPDRGKLKDIGHISQLVKKIGGKMPQKP